jgi:hypothetical protein
MWQPWVGLSSAEGLLRTTLASSAARARHSPCWWWSPTHGSPPSTKPKRLQPLKLGTWNLESDDDDVRQTDFNRVRVLVCTVDRELEELSKLTSSEWAPWRAMAAQMAQTFVHTCALALGAARMATSSAARAARCVLDDSGRKNNFTLHGPRVLVRCMAVPSACLSGGLST